MEIIKIPIQQVKQDNGLWGTPYNCYSLTINDFINDNRKSQILSGLICAINEKFNKKFKVVSYTDNIHFYVYSGDSVINYILKYDEYELVDDIIYEFESDKDRINFIRKNKIKQLKYYDKPEIVKL